MSLQGKLVLQSDLNLFSHRFQEVYIKNHMVKTTSVVSMFFSDDYKFISTWYSQSKELMSTIVVYATVDTPDKNSFG